MYRILIAAAMGAALAGATEAHGQEATERFIPIGQSPGQSGRSTTIGSLTRVDAGRRVITVTSDGAPRDLKLTDRTTIWIDRSRSRQPNGKGTLGDLRAGGRVEVKWDSRDRSLAEWIKIEAPAP